MASVEKVDDAIIGPTFYYSGIPTFTEICLSMKKLIRKSEPCSSSGKIASIIIRDKL